MRFVTDRMLGKLSTWLRILGYDTVYAADLDVKGDEDRFIVTLAEREGRILLTRDRGMIREAKRRGIQHVYVRDGEVMEQLKELLHHRIDINLEPVPRRCSICNGELRKVKEGEEAMLLAKSYVPRDKIGKTEFWVCNNCGRIYWKGSHWLNMRARLNDVKGKNRKILNMEETD